MSETKRNEFPDFAALGKSVDDMINSLPVLIKNSAINFFKDRFEVKGWIDQSFDAWQDRQNDDTSKGSLLLISGNLKSSIVGDVTKNTIIISSDTPYSRTHNEGGMVTIPITARSRKFFWFMYYKTKEDKWRNMALTKATSFSFNMSKRQFMGHSDFLMKSLEANFNEQLNKIVKRDL